MTTQTGDPIPGRSPEPAAASESPRPRVAIAGGSGFIGRRLCAVLGSAGYDVVVLTRTAGRAAIGPIRFAHWQPQDAEGNDAWTQHLEGARAVVNLCGESIGGPRWTDARKARLIASRVEPARALVNAINRAAVPPAVLIQASGVGYYGTGNEPVDESGANGTDFLADLAARWEAPLADLRSDVRGIITRSGVVLGRGGGALPQMLMPFRLFVGGPVASGNQWLSWIHLHDAAAIMKELIEQPDRSGIINLVAPHPVRSRSFARAAGKSLQRPSWMFTPRVVLKVLLGEQATLICDGQQAISRRLDDYPFSFPDIDSALLDLV